MASGLITPTSLAFLGPNDMFVLEKNTGRVLRVVEGVVGPTVLDLAVNFASERGLLGVALHPDFPDTPFVYLYWTESTIGAGTDVLSETPLLGNRVDRFMWDGSTLTFDRNLIHIRAIQEDGAPLPAGQGDEGQVARGNHDAGVIAFGPEGKLYILIGDVGRRGQLQNRPSGPTLTGLGPTVPDDQFGGPQPDDAHFTGVIVRLNDDGTVPSDNPFFPAGAALGGEVGANIQKIFAHPTESVGLLRERAQHSGLPRRGDSGSAGQVGRSSRVGPAGLGPGWVLDAFPRCAEGDQATRTSTGGKYGRADSV